MIRNLTPTPVHLYAPDTPETLPYDDRDHGLVAVIHPADTPATVTTGHHGEALPVDHDGQLIRADLVTHLVQGLPRYRHDVRLIVTADVAMAAGPRSDLLLLGRPVHAPDGDVLGHRIPLGSVC